MRARVCVLRLHTRVVRRNIDVQCNNPSHRRRLMTQPSTVLSATPMLRSAGAEHRLIGGQVAITVIANAPTAVRKLCGNITG